MHKSMFKTACGAFIILMLFVHGAWAQSETITRENWGATAGFKPNLDIPGYQAGMIIDSGNVDQFSKVIPEPVLIMIKKYHLKLATRGYEPYAPSRGYIAATNKNRGSARLVEIGESAETTGLENYHSGLPFPDPKSGSEAAWNFFHSYHGDDGKHEFGVFWISAKKGVESSERWRWTVLGNTMHRTDIEPIPRLEKIAKRKIAASSITEILSPLDRKGQMALYNVYDNPVDREGWIYIPAQKRTMRFTSENHGESWNNTDLFYEDIRGYSGRPEWMNWKIIGRATMLAPMYAGVEYGPDAAGKTYDFENYPHWNPRLKWQPRPVYILELIPKLKKYPYSRQVLFVDAEAYYAHAKLAYDRKGQPWKLVLNASNKSEDPASMPLTIATSLVIDLQAEHATAFPWYEYRANTGVDPDMFSLTTLRRRAR